MKSAAAPFMSAVGTSPKPVEAEVEEDEAEKDARHYDGFGSHG